MKHNKWMVACLGWLVACAIPGALGKMFIVLMFIGCAGLCFFEWVVEEEKYQQEEHKKYLESLKKKA